MAAPEQEPSPQEDPEEESEPPEAAASKPPTQKRVIPGVLYLSHIPPGFGPRHARTLLAPHGELGRVFLRPQDDQLWKSRKRGGGHLRRSRRIGGAPPGGPFAEGWVEFRDKRAAKRAARILQGTPIAPRGPLRHHHWNLKYLPGFRWPHLSERLSSERLLLAQRLRLSAAQAKRQGAWLSRTPAHPQTLPPPGAVTPTSTLAPPPQHRPPRQRPTDAEIGRRKVPPPPIQNLLGKVFGRGRKEPLT